MPCFDQSVARHVGLVLSKILTPLWISSMMVSFDCLNACCSVSSQWNLLLGLSSSRKGSIVSAMLNAYDTWFTKPNQDLTSVRLCGVGKSEMATMAWLHSVIGDFEVCEFNFVLNKSELLGIVCHSSMLGRSFLLLYHTIGGCHLCIWFCLR